MLQRSCIIHFQWRHQHFDWEALPWIFRNLFTGIRYQRTRGTHGVCELVHISILHQSSVSTTKTWSCSSLLANTPMTRSFISPWVLKTQLHDCLSCRVYSGIRLVPEERPATQPGQLGGSTGNQLSVANCGNVLYPSASPVSVTGVDLPVLRFVLKQRVTFENTSRWLLGNC